MKKQKNSDAFLNNKDLFRTSILFAIFTINNEVILSLLMRECREKGFKIAFFFNLNGGAGILFWLCYLVWKVAMCVCVCACGFALKLVLIEFP